jgi:hypothetical protein
MTAETRVPLYDRLPEIYRVRDAEQTPPGMLAAYLRAVETVYGAIDENIEALYDDLFIDTCDDWVVPYIADLLGTTHLKGPPRTLRADVADTIALRRRKGTLSAIERLARNLTDWPARAVELRPNVAWAQHLNHQRPDRGGRPPYGLADVGPSTPRVGGTVAVRDPAMLELLGTPFDPYAYTPDVKRADDGAVHVNLPNLAIYLWRLAAFRLPVVRPLLKGVTDTGPAAPGNGLARFILRVDLDALDRPVRLFNTWRRPEAAAVDGVERLTEPDAVAGPILPARLETGSEAGNPSAYVSVDAFDAAAVPPTGLDLGDTGLQLYLPASILDGVAWRFRADNLCAWEAGIARPLGLHEISIDPVIGRLLIGVASAAERDVLRTAAGAPRFLAGYSYGAVGPVGAHPVSRDPAVPAGTAVRVVDGLAGGPTLQDQLANLHTLTGPLIVEIRDSLVHDLNPETLAGALAEGGRVALRLAHPVTIRAAAGMRPVIRLARPLGLRPADPAAPEVRTLSFRLEGVFLTRAAGFPANRALVERLALARFECTGATLDPGGHVQRDGTRATLLPAIEAAAGYGFANAADLAAFGAVPEIVLVRSVAGAIRADAGYRLSVQDSIVDAGVGPDDPPGAARAVASVADPAQVPGPPLSVSGATFLGPVHVREARGAGAIFTHRLTVWNHQVGCLRQCRFSGQGDRLPPHRACVSGPGARVAFTSIRHGQPGYGQLARGTDERVLTRGPGDDAMGAFGFLQEAHRRTNLDIRLREFMPVGVRALVVTLT